MSGRGCVGESSDSPIADTHPVRLISTKPSLTDDLLFTGTHIAPETAAMPSRASYVLQGAIVTSLASVGAFYNWTKHCEISSPLDPNIEPLFKSSFFRRYNPHNNFANSDVITRRVPLHHLKPDLIEDSHNGGSKLVEHFCGAIWSSSGKWHSIYASQSGWWCELVLAAIELASK